MLSHSNGYACLELLLIFFFLYAGHRYIRNSNYRRGRRDGSPDALWFELETLLLGQGITTLLTHQSDVNYMLLILNNRNWIVIELYIESHKLFWYIL